MRLGLLCSVNGSNFENIFINFSDDFVSGKHNLIQIVSFEMMGGFQSNIHMHV